MNLVSALASSVQKHPGKKALFWGEQEFSYSTLWEQSIFVSERLRALGVKPGDRVALWLKNCPEFIPVLFGILHAEGVVVPINNFLKPAEVNYIIGDAGANILVTDEELGAHFEGLKEHRPGLQMFSVEALNGAQLNSKDASADLAEALKPKNRAARIPGEIPGDLAVIIYTSGTTGKPKGAMLSHGNLLHNVESCRIVLQTVAADRFAVLLPMFHSYMLTVGILLPLLVGGSIVLVKSLHPVRNALQEIIARETSILPAIPQFYRSLVSAPGQIPLPVRLCVS